LQDEQLTFFGGAAGKSGGVQVLYGKGDKGLLFDFGVEHGCLLFPAWMTTYDPVFVTPKREVRQYILGGMTAPLLELYDPEQVKGLDTAAVSRVWDNTEFPSYGQLGVFIGHMHQDHIALLPYTNPDIPVYMSNDSHSLYRGLVAADHYPDTAAKITVCDDLSTVDFGEFTMQIVEMDHNATGAAGIIIESKDYKIAYTGDWRRHGKHPERIDRFINLCRDKGIDVLITEGTRVIEEPESQPPFQESEEKVMARFAALLSQVKGLVYLQMSPRDLERMADMIQIAVEQGRKIVMDAAHAVIWNTAIREGLNILENHPALGAAIQVVDATVVPGMAQPYETITLEQIAEQKKDYLYFFKFPNLAHIIELETLGSPCEGSHFIAADYSVKLDNAIINKFLKTYGITGHSLTNGGHAHPTFISDLIERIAPKVVIPLHTRFPRSLDTKGIRAYYPEKGESLSIASLMK
jgi:mRNA degradation ribonuclease J1/J2